MITLIHGDDIAASRNFYFELKQQYVDLTILNGTTITQTDLQQALSGGDLFGNVPHIFIDELLSKRKPSKELDGIISVVQSASTVEIVLWESKELTKKQLQPFDLLRAIVKEFKIPSTIFAFLDAIRPNNRKQLIELFYKTLQDKDPEFVLFMLTRLVRTLLAINSSSAIANEAWQFHATNNELGQISEVARLAPWQKGKLDKQAKQFTLGQLLKLHNALFQVELDMKTGGLTLPLAESMDLLILSI